ncbi:MAG TPA: amidohydrolase family protein [Pyrinomonadaceae bacterium]|nr:amidohydrolase family protein [Pyrinomonadaceae bacterium]
MNKKILLILILVLSFSCRYSNREFITVDAPLIALTHVRVIDGSGAPAREDQTILIEQGRIKALGSAGDIPANAKVLDLSGRTAIPGLVGMHDHLFYTAERGKKEVAANASFARLYLASGVTTIRTAGALDFHADRTTKQLVDRGEWPGPKIHLTSPYVNHSAESPAELENLSQQMNDWADEGVTSFKVYTNTTRAELATVIAVAHKRGLKVAGHLCAVGFREAADLGIDSLEHGLAVDTEFYSGKKVDQCPERSQWLPELARMDVHSAPIQAMIRDLVNHRVAVTSTLAILEAFLGERFQMDPRMKDVLSEAAYSNCVSQMEHDKADPRWAKVWEMVLKREMEFEREFVKAGGLLMSGVDPTGWGGVVAGFGDQRGIELLVQAGFTPLEAIRIASANGAQFLGQADIGTLEVGKQADIVIVRGNPATNIADVKNVEAVFKDGVGYDSARLIASVRGQVGA